MLVLLYDHGHRVTTTDPHFVEGFIQMFQDGWVLPYATPVHELKAVYVREPDGHKTYLFRHKEDQ